MKNGWIIGLIVFITAGFLICGYLAYNYHQKYKEAQKREYWEELDFKTQIVKLSKAFEEFKKDTFQKVIQPKIEYHYHNSTTSNKVVFDGSDSLIKVTDSLQNVLASIDTKFLKLYPKSPKLLSGLFTGDTLALDLLEIDGAIKTTLYLTNYSKYNYQYLDGAIRIKENSKGNSNPISPPHKTFNHSSFYLTGGYSVITPSPILGLDYVFLRKKFIFQTSANSMITPKPGYVILAKVGYKIF